MSKTYKLQCSRHKREDGKEARAYFITVPTSTIDQRQFREGQEFEWIINGDGQLVLRPKINIV
ncbi:MAG: hypothetical protein Q7T16_04580 [Candidatus Burarchaeum sp.]|nr:hypothetical protein [Candidatus Burarchaeum sp.]MDO8339904.1 hypothetical protein [Candidatus Burarchaeum sp.]